MEKIIEKLHRIGKKKIEEGEPDGK